MTRVVGIWASAVLACVAGAQADSNLAAPDPAVLNAQNTALQSSIDSAAPPANGTAPATTPGDDPDAAYWYQLPDDFDMLVSPPDINLSRSTQLWTGNVLGNATKGTKLRPAYWRAKSASGRIINLQTGHFSFDISGIKAGSRDLAEAANVQLMLSKMSMNAKLSASAGKGSDNPDLWQKNRAEIEMKVNAVPKTEVAFSGADEITQTYREPGSLGVTGQRHVLQANKREAKVVATISAIDGVSLDMGARGSS
ncbi:MAG: hypothetical protein WCD42_06210 [Rhizomicrobium sp.]